MTTHLSPEEWVAAADGTLESSREAHASDCAACRLEIARVREMLGRVAEAEVPEPSPLFWDHFSMRVRLATRHEPVRRPGSAAAAWTSLAAVAATVVFAVWVVRQPAPLADPLQPRVELDSGASEWESMVAATGEWPDDLWLDWSDDMHGVGVDELTTAERVVFVRLLEQEMDVTP
jgi:hypothetical protein